MRLAAALSRVPLLSRRLSRGMSSFLEPTPLAQQLLAPIRAAQIIVADEVPAVNRDTDLLIGTHDGSFHCDEALAISLLHLTAHGGKQLKVVRTRNPDVLEKCDIVVDVGAVYDPARHRYDHHQREFADTFPGYSTRLSSAGLVYLHFGREITTSVCRSVLNNEELHADSEVVRVVYEKVYRDFMEHVDAIDNGVAVAAGDLRYHVSTTLSSRVGAFNAPWNAPASPQEINQRFLAAMHTAGAEYVAQLTALLTVWWPARAIVQGALDDRIQHDTEGRIVVLFHYCPWVQHLFEIERSATAAAAAAAQGVVYVLYEDSSRSWRVQAVPISEHSFESRRALPAEWRGLRDQALSDKTGVPGCIFVHASGFIGGAQTKEAALALAQLALRV